MKQRSRTPRKRFRRAKPGTADENGIQQGVPPLRATSGAKVNADVRAQKMKYIAPTIVLLAALFSSGCAVLSMLGHPKPEYSEIRKGYFPATKTDVIAIKGLYTNDTAIPLRIIGTPLLILDMPFSLCYDIVDAPFKSIEKAQTRKTKRLEQSGPGYPPQSVGSPDP